ncbi:hypothetical protein CPB83DRAFT_889796 [Crepidotus variabilis]|uniref:Uncharacterized protein n=1 Tax=Crepidotus variabilis TaxID=179855 RepID=A0A9P6ERV5_9AGAR|nr:hypothetical protein CPB83DRAFT_889796 [Crepidotus variabilis]
MSDIQALPRPNPYDSSKEFIIFQAYYRCLDLEKCHANVVQEGTSTMSALLRSRFLGHLIREAPTPEGREIFCRQIIKAKYDKDLQRLAKTYVDYFVICWHNPAVKLDYLPEGDSSHKISNRERAIQDKAYVTSAQSFLESYCQISRLEDDRVDQLENLLTLDQSMRQWFNTLKTWLERKPQDPVNEYHFEAVHEGLFIDVQSTIRLTTPDPLSTRCLILVIWLFRLLARVFLTFPVLKHTSPVF